MATKKAAAKKAAPKAAKAAAVQPAPLLHTGEDYAEANPAADAAQAGQAGADPVQAETPAPEKATEPAAAALEKPIPGLDALALAPAGEVTVEDIAMCCHEANCAYCASIGDDSQKPWDEASESQRASALAGVRYTLANPGVTPEMQHAAWVNDKVAAGWFYGETKDEARKTHPCLVGYAELPAFQRTKDKLFLAVVRGLESRLAPAG